MDEANVLLATRVIALCLEPISDPSDTVATGLTLIAELYRARGDGRRAAQLTKNAADVRVGRSTGNAKCPKSLRAIINNLAENPLTGDPGRSLGWSSIFWASTVDAAFRTRLRKSGTVEETMNARERWSRQQSPRIKSSVPMETLPASM